MQLQATNLLALNLQRNTIILNDQVEEGAMTDTDDKGKFS